MKHLLLFLSFACLAINLTAQSTPPIVINEFMASNDTTAADQDGEFDDWIELYNNTNTAFSLTGFYLSDNPEDLTRWAFPDGTTIAANGYLIIWADGDLNQAGLHADFGLSGNGETVLLTNADLAIIDSISYPAQETDISYGRFPNGTGDFQQMDATFNAENTEGVTDPDDPELLVSLLAGQLVINEFMASNDATAADQDGEFDDWIELYNNTDVPISLGGFFLTDDLNDLTKWAFPAGTLLIENGYLIIWADGDTDQDGLHADFGLSGGGETLLLLDTNGALIDSITYPAQETDISHGRFPNGTGTFRDMSPTFNAENNEGITSIRPEQLNGAELTLFPNPTSGRVNVQLAQAFTSDLHFRFFAADGRMLRQASLPQGGIQLEIDATTLPDGLYFLSVTDGRATDTRKVIIRR